MVPREIFGGVLLVALAAGGAAMIEVGPSLFPEHAALIFWSGLGLVLSSLVGLALMMFWKPKRRKPMGDDEEIGDDNTYVNATPPRKAGSRNTVVGPTQGTDAIYNRPGTSIGAGAGYSPTGVIIGSGAGAGLNKKKKDGEG